MSCWSLLIEPGEYEQGCACSASVGHSTRAIEASLPGSLFLNVGTQLTRWRGFCRRFYTVLHFSDVYLQRCWRPTRRLSRTRTV